MRRKPGELLPLERDICETAARLARAFHGFELAKALADGLDRKTLTGYGTLYRALARLEDMGLLNSVWEDPQVAADEGRPRRRLYTLTGLGEALVCEFTTVRRATRKRTNKLAPA